MTHLEHRAALKRVRANVEILAVVMGISLAISSCLPMESVHPIATPRDTLWYAAWKGDWAAVSNPHYGGLIHLYFYPPHTASLTMRGDRDGKQVYELNPVRLGGRWFADARLSELWTGEDALDSTAMETNIWAFRHYYVLRLDASADSDSITISFLSDSTRHAGLKIRKRGEAVELTSTPDQIRRFLVTYGGVDSLFDRFAVLTRTN